MKLPKEVVDALDAGPRFGVGSPLWTELYETGLRDATLREAAERHAGAWREYAENTEHFLKRIVQIDRYGGAAWFCLLLFLWGSQFFSLFKLDPAMRMDAARVVLEVVFAVFTGLSGVGWAHLMVEGKETAAVLRRLAGHARENEKGWLEIARVAGGRM